MIELTQEAKTLPHPHVRGNSSSDPGDRTIHQIFEEKALETPQAVALILGETHVTYAELDATATALAHRLAARGVRTESRVGLFMDRSIEMITGLLAVMKAGGAYVPLDPAYPAKRISFMLEDSQSHVVLSQRALQPLLPATGAAVIFLDKPDEAPSAENAPLPSVHPENLAYIIYTSGSTGRPKGVMIEHRGLSNLAAAQAEVFAVRPESRVLQFASLSFDASISEIAMTWRAGATLCLARRESLLPGPNLIDLLRSQEITHVTLPPSILAALPDAELPALGTLITAGEACSAEIVTRWAPGRRFFNAYGPTETTVCATIGRCRAGDRRPSIGRAIRNTEVLLLDADTSPVPPGTTGEIHVGGISLARGYLNQPQLTAEKFIPHPYSSRPGARLYRSGDLARALPDGRLEFLGRIDHQVKINGYRIELGEIEATLSRHPDVQHVAVLARNGTTGEKRLVAYVVPVAPEACATGELRSFCRQHLPDYMAPSVFVRLDSFPLTVNGKIDREALPAPVLERSPNFVAPRTELERRIAAIWSDTIQLGEVGVDDNFFEIGGDSLKLAEAHSRLNRELGRALPVTALFQHPTVSLLAKYLQAESRTNPAISCSAPERARRRRQTLMRRQPKSPARQ